MEKKSGEKIFQKSYITDVRYPQIQRDANLLSALSRKA